MGLAQAVTKMSELDYYELERSAAFKSEFCDGEMFAMAGGSPAHSLIATNLGAELRSALRGRPCVPYNADLRVKIPDSGLITYPDLSVICGPLEFAFPADDTVTNPSLVVEVLSPSTEAYDRGRKFENYRRLRSLREYLLVRQDEPHVELFIRQPDESWLLREATGMDARLELPALKIALALAEIYLNVEFIPGPIRPPTPRA